MYEFSSIIIKSGGILTVKGWDGNNVYSGVLYLMVHGSVLIEAYAEINLIGKGYHGGIAPPSSSTTVMNSTNPTTTTNTPLVTTPTHAAVINASPSQEIMFNVNGAILSPNAVINQQGYGESYDEGLGGNAGHASNRIGTLGGGGGGYITEGKPAKPNTFGGQWNFPSDILGGKGGKALIIDPNESIESYMRMGSGGGGGSGIGENIGGSGGNGGGLLIIQAKELRNFGAITVNGESGQDGNCQNSYSSGGGGGSGGCIKIDASTIINHGSITALGGKGGIATFDENTSGNNCSNGGDGGNGLIILKYDSLIGQGFQPEPKTIPN